MRNLSILYKARCLIKMPSAFLFKVNVYVILSGRMSGATHGTIYHYSTPLYYLFPEYFGATAGAAVLCSLLFRTVPSFLTGSLDLFLFSAPVFLMTPCSTCRFFLLTYPYQFRYFLLTFRKKSDIIQNEQCSFWR